MIPENEARALMLAEAAFLEARERAGPEMVRCGRGCAECCHRPFSITAEDARRLVRGLAAADPAVAADIQARALTAATEFSSTFPGDTESGAFTGNDEWREWFFRQQQGVPCPVLDIESGVCRLYEHRPVACRAAGPLVQLGAAIYPPCHLNYRGATPDQMRAWTVAIDDPVFHEPANEPETLIAYAISRTRF